MSLLEEVNLIKIDQDKLINILNKKWEYRICPMCGSEDWIVSDKIFELREFNDDKFIKNDLPIQPLVTITCKECGNTILINTLVLDLLD